MPDEEWIKTLEDGRKVKFIYQELPKDGTFITAQKRPSLAGLPGRAAQDNAGPDGEREVRR
jgi:hypothetical protein